jgi:hypothetical protein
MKFECSIVGRYLAMDPPGVIDTVYSDDIFFHLPSGIKLLKKRFFLFLILLSSSA